MDNVANTKVEIFVTRSSMPPYEEYIELIKPLWDTHWLTNMGKFHRQLESELKEYLNVPQLSLMVNGHMALELAIQAFGFPEGAEVITTPFTFISTTHAIVRNRLTPVFCDVKPEDGTIDETKIEQLITDKTVAILPVHVFGNICNVDEIGRIADEHRLKVIYDAAHAFGEKYRGKSVGNFGDASVFSFHATKVYNTIEGGAVAFQDESFYGKLYNLKNFGIHGEELVTEVGANAKMNEFAAAMGLCNLRHIAAAIAARKQCVEVYRGALSGIDGIKVFKENLDTDSNYGYMPIVICDDYAMSRDELYDKMREQGIRCRKYFYPLTADQMCYRERQWDCAIDEARRLSDSVLALPLYEDLQEIDINRILKVMKYEKGL